MAKVAGASTPRSVTLATVQSVGSSAVTVAPANLAASKEQARCADAGMGALARAWAGAVTDATGKPSGVVSDDAPMAAIALLTGNEAEAQGNAAKRLRDAAAALDCPEGSVRFYVTFCLLFFLVPLS